MSAIEKNPYARVLRVIEGFHKMVNNIFTSDPSYVNEMMNDFYEFDNSCDEIRDELKNTKESNNEILELDSKQKILQHVEEMRPIIEKMKSLKAFW